MFRVLDGPIEPLVTKANGLSGIDGPGGGTVAKYGAPIIEWQILHSTKKMEMLYITMNYFINDL